MSTQTQKRVKVYDFRKPDKFIKDQIRSLHLIHETIGTLLSSKLSIRLRMNASFHLELVDQLTFEEFLRETPKPAVLGITHMSPLKGAAMIEFPPSLTQLCIDRLAGGTGSTDVQSRELSVLEMKLMEEVFEKILECFNEGWSSCFQLQCRFQDIERDVRFAQIIPPSEMIVLVAYGVSIGKAEGKLRICLPALTLEPILERLRRNYWYSSIRPGKAAPVDQVPQIGNINLESAVFYEADPVSLKDLHNIRKESLLHLPGYQKNKAYLQAGTDPVIPLFRTSDGTREELTFSLPEEAQVSEMEIRLIRLKERKKETREQQFWQATLQKPLDVVTDKLEELGKDLKVLNRKQDEILDQYYYRTQSEDMPSVPAGPEKQETMPLAGIAEEDKENLFFLIQHEHPQIIALILCHVANPIAVYCLSQIPDMLKVDVTERIMNIEFVSPDLLMAFRDVLLQKLEEMRSPLNRPAGGVKKIVDILNYSSRQIEKYVIETLEKKNAEMAETIKKNMFVFEDITILAKDTMTKLVKRIDWNDLLLASKPVVEEVKNFICANLPDEKAQQYRNGLEQLGRVRLSDVDKAQQRIVSTIRKMDVEGEIVVARLGETVD